jgi:hypothetical protein
MRSSTWESKSNCTAGGLSPYPRRSTSTTLYSSANSRRFGEGLLSGVEAAVDEHDRLALAEADDVQIGLHLAAYLEWCRHMDEIVDEQDRGN